MDELRTLAPEMMKILKAATILGLTSIFTFAITMVLAIFTLKFDLAYFFLALTSLLAGMFEGMFFAYAILKRRLKKMSEKDS